MPQTTKFIPIAPAPKPNVEQIAKIIKAKKVVSNMAERIVEHISVIDKRKVRAVDIEKILTEVELSSKATINDARSTLSQINLEVYSQLPWMQKFPLGCDLLPSTAGGNFFYLQNLLDPIKIEFENKSYQNKINLTRQYPVLNSIVNFIYAAEQFRESVLNVPNPYSSQPINIYWRREGALQVAKWFLSSEFKVTSIDKDLEPLSATTSYERRDLNFSQAGVIPLAFLDSLQILNVQNKNFKISVSFEREESQRLPCKYNIPKNLKNLIEEATYSPSQNSITAEDLDECLELRAENSSIRLQMKSFQEKLKTVKSMCDDFQSKVVFKDASGVIRPVEHFVQENALLKDEIAQLRLKLTATTAELEDYKISAKNFWNGKHKDEITQLRLKLTATTAELEDCKISAKNFWNGKHENKETGSQAALASSELRNKRLSRDITNLKTMNTKLSNANAALKADALKVADDRVSILGKHVAELNKFAVDAAFNVNKTNELARKVCELQMQLLNVKTESVGIAQPPPCNQGGLATRPVTVLQSASSAFHQPTWGESLGMAGPPYSVTPSQIVTQVLPTVSKNHPFHRSWEDNDSLTLRGPDGEIASQAVDPAVLPAEISFPFIQPGEPPAKIMKLQLDRLAESHALIEEEGQAAPAVAAQRLHRADLPSSIPFNFYKERE